MAWQTAREVWARLALAWWEPLGVQMLALAPALLAGVSLLASEQAEAHSQGLAAVEPVASAPTVAQAAGEHLGQVVPEASPSGVRGLAAVEQVASARMVGQAFCLVTWSTAVLVAAPEAFDLWA